MADSKTEQQRKRKVNLEDFILPESKEVSKNDGYISEGYRSQFKGTLTSQNWKNMTIKENNKNRRTIVIASWVPSDTQGKKLKLQRKFFFTEYQLTNIKNDRKLSFWQPPF